ncbi:MAG: DUF2075 domain-containing protein [Clostridiales bacterium]|nr:DUF2075 domain-containing protein [Clostridiales bacterium]
MIVYEGNKRTFIEDVSNGVMVRKIEEMFNKLGIRKEQQAEMNSWKNSLPRMGNIISDSRIDDDVDVAVEYQIPFTSCRVDFMVAGQNEKSDNVVVIELKQWETCQATPIDNVVNAFTGGANRNVPHPSQQVYSYAKLIQNFNESIQEENIDMIPCAYLHNYEEKNRGEICNPRYNEIIKLAPVFLMEDGKQLKDFLAEYVSKPSNKKLFEIIDHGKLKPSKSLQSAVGSILNGKQEFELIDEQMVAYSTILKLVQNSIDSDEKHTVIVKGGPGTGKSVIAINLLTKILNNGYSCCYVTKNSAPRAAFSQTLIKGNYSLSYLKGLFKGSGSFTDTPNNAFDCIITDEAHRLNEKSGLFANKGENQIKEIIKSSKISVFFVDEDQIVTTKDIGRVDEIKAWARLLGSKVHQNESLELKSQFRCNGSDGYIAFLDDVLEIRETANYNFFDLNYDIRVFDNPNEMKEELRKKNTNNKSRMIAGYCYPWNSKDDKSQYDIFLEYGFKAQWNFTTDRFAIDPDSFEQVGCIHSTQGLEFDYVGIIIGLDLRYVNGHVITDRFKRAKTDASIKGLNGNNSLGDRIIRNTYKTLLSRGQKGCFIYCEDKALSKYLRQRLSMGGHS